MDTEEEYSKAIKIGDKIKIQLKDGSEKIYTIKIPSETDPSNGIISNECPIGRAVLGRKVGDSISYEVGDNTFSAKIVEVITN